ncbi:hypothetical protein K227x_53610 [Rubripirellula lacrimiformis]|uniref:Uncharacterized protein n=1 Tax=Rubripirellula lacrimiformis TaxID=1930273 RepID=A0A517NIH8_9BACT|nr:hypothetical protein K227x_53610 [Rubripirellula lacrimiformis]
MLFMTNCAAIAGASDLLAIVQVATIWKDWLETHFG